MNLRTIRYAALASALLGLAHAADAGANLLPNGDFEGKEPLIGWLTGFPDEASTNKKVWLYVTELEGGAAGAAAEVSSPRAS